MKNFFKFGCLGIIGIVVLVIILAVFSGGDDDKVSTGSDSKTTENKESASKKDDGSKKFNASSQQVDAIGLKVGLGEIKIKENKIQVGINVENTTDKAISFYPDQGSAVVGNIQLDANMFLTDGSVSGDIQSGVKQDAVLEFLVPEGKKIDVNSVKEIKLILGDVNDEDFTKNDKVNFTVPVK